MPALVDYTVMDESIGTPFFQKMHHQKSYCLSALGQHKKQAKFDIILHKTQKTDWTKSLAPY